MTAVLNHRLGGSGNGPALLLLHPLGADLTFWDECRTHWQESVRCIACDMRSAGASPPATEPVTPEIAAADLENLRAHLGIDCMVIVACAVATLTAVAYAGRHPERVSGLVLSNPVCRTHAAAGEMLARRAAVVRRQGIAALLPDAIDNAFLGCPDDRRRRRYRERFAAQDPEGYACAALGAVGADVTDDLKRIRCPVCLVAGSNDRLLPPERALEIRDLLPLAELEVVEGGAHFIPYQRPEQFAATVIGFLKRHDLATVTDVSRQNGRFATEVPMTDAHEPPRRHLPIRQDWLARRPEEAIEPDLPIVDAHHHLWDKDDGRYLLHDFVADLSSGHEIAATVFIECHTAYRQHGPEHLRSLGETEFAAQQAAMSDAEQPGTTRIAAAIVGNVDLRLGDRVEPVLEAHTAASDGRFRGVRNTSAWHADPAARGSLLSPPPGLLKDRSFREGVRRLARQTLSFDAWMYHTQLPEAVELAAACPDTTIVLNHAGGPIGIGPYAGRRSEVFEAWRKDIRDLARRPNVFAKLGGFGMRLFGFDVHARDLPPTSDDLARAWAPYIEESIDAFGPGRCMFESNFPVDKGSCSYGVLWNAYKKVVAGCTAAEKSLLFHATAERVYRTGTRD